MAASYRAPPAISAADISQRQPELPAGATGTLHHRPVSLGVTRKQAPASEHLQDDAAGTDARWCHPAPAAWQKERRGRPAGVAAASRGGGADGTFAAHGSPAALATAVYRSHGTTGQSAQKPGRAAGTWAGHRPKASMRQPLRRGRGCRPRRAPRDRRARRCTSPSHHMIGIRSSSPIAPARSSRHGQRPQRGRGQRPQRGRGLGTASAWARAGPQPGRGRRPQPGRGRRPQPGQRPRQELLTRDRCRAPPGLAIAGRVGAAIIPELGEPAVRLEPVVLLERASVVGGS